MQFVSPMPVAGPELIRVNYVRANCLVTCCMLSTPLQYLGEIRKRVPLNFVSVVEGTRRNTTEHSGTYILGSPWQGVPPKRLRVPQYGLELIDSKACHSRF